MVSILLAGANCMDNSVLYRCLGTAASVQKSAITWWVRTMQTRAAQDHFNSANWLVFSPSNMALSGKHSCWAAENQVAPATQMPQTRLFPRLVV